MSEKLLVVEDSRPIAKVIKQIAESLYYEVTVATNLAEVKVLLEGGNKYFAATIDYALPDAIDGEAIPYVLSHGIPGLVLTGKMDDDTRAKILAQPVIDYIPKENSQAFLYLKRILKWQLTNREIGVLVVDDSRTARKHVTELLKRRNFITYNAADGKEGLEILAKHKNIKMIITDLEMPVMDGIVFTNEVRKLYSREHLAIIGISGATNGVHSARFIKNGADDFLRKPFCPEEFYCRITQNIENLANIADIEKAANTDYLTNLANRRSFFSTAESRIASCIQKSIPYCLAMVDLDLFKKVNDTYGHDAGDIVLKTVALYMRKHFSSGLTARLGGEEFAILIAGVDEDQLYMKLDDFRREIAVALFPIGDDQISITVSIGISLNSKDPLTTQVGEADTALYAAKENGRNQLCIFGSHEDLDD